MTDLATDPLRTQRFGLRARIISTGFFLATFLAFGNFSLQLTSAAITVVPVNDVEVTITSELGSDFFSLKTGNGETAFFFGNQDSSNLNTADRVPLSEGDSQQYFQAETSIPSMLGTPQGSTLAYWFDSVPFGGATAGDNFTVYDANQDGTVDTVFRLGFGPVLSDHLDDFIVSYAFDSSAAGIDVAAARTALLVPEPAAVTLVGLGIIMGFATSRKSRRGQSKK